MGSTTTFERLVRAIDFLRRSRRGGATRLDRRLGKSEGYLNKALSGRIPLSVDVLCQVIEALGFKPGSFFSHVFADDEPLEPDPFLEALERDAEKPAVLKRVEPLLKIEGTARVDVRDREEERRLAGLWHGVTWLRELRVSEPRKARDEAVDLLTEVAEEIESHGNPLTLLAAVLLELGRTEHVLTHVGTSACYLRRALELARRHDDDATADGVLLASARLLADEGLYPAALALCDRGRETSTLRHDLAGVGRALCERGTLLYRMGRLDDAVGHLQAGMAYLPAEDWHARLDAVQCLGLVFVELGDMQRAIQIVTLGEAIHRTKEGLGWWRLARIRSEVEMAAKNFDVAQFAFSNLLEVLLDQRRYHEAALVFLRLTRVLQFTGEREELEHQVEKMTSLVGHVRTQNATMARLLERFLERADAGSVTLEDLDLTYNALRDAFVHR